MAAALGCLVVSAAVAGCSAEGSSGHEPSAKQMLDDANDVMNALKSVTVDGKTTTVATGEGFSTRLTTDLKGTCRFSQTWTNSARLEQIRIGDVDYVRPNRAYLKMAGEDGTAKGEQKRWVKSPAKETAFESEEAGLSHCTREFGSFGKATKGDPTEVDGRRAIPLVVTDKAVKEGAYTFYVATEGKPYLLKVAYKGTDYRTTTTFSDFDKPVDVRAPAKGDVLDASGIEPLT